MYYILQYSSVSQEPRSPQERPGPFKQIEHAAVEEAAQAVNEGAAGSCTILHSTSFHMVKDIEGCILTSVLDKHEYKLGPSLCLVTHTSHV
jgi:hypothetical protein